MLIKIHHTQQKARSQEKRETREQLYIIAINKLPFSSIKSEPHNAHTYVYIIHPFSTPLLMLLALMLRHK
jgi:hypothetical protein